MHIMRCQKGCLKSNMIDKRKAQLVKFVNMLSYHISATRGISVTLNDIQSGLKSPVLNWCLTQPMNTLLSMFLWDFRTAVMA